MFTVRDTTNIPAPSVFFTGESSVRLIDTLIDPLIVEKKLYNQGPDKARGDDELSPRLLSGVSKELAIPLSHIFRESLDNGSVPDDWRRAKVSPLFKKGRTCHANNYKLVSLTSQIVKVMESIVRDAVVQHRDRFNLISDSRHRFLKGFLCVTNLLSLEFVTNNVNNRMNVDIVFLDFAKAFDKVPHLRLLLKLSALGMDGAIKDWIKAWLTEGWQRVCIDGSTSSWRRVTSEVARG